MYGESPVSDGEGDGVGGAARSPRLDGIEDTCELSAIDDDGRCLDVMSMWSTAHGTRVIS